jgi:hypothetical protein
MRLPPTRALYQIACLASLLGYGWLALGLRRRGRPDRGDARAALAAPVRVRPRGRLPRFDPKSALISGLSLCLLLRTDEPLLAAVAAVLAIGGKFVLRVRGKHVFNPTNFGLMVMVLGHDRVWASSGQWGPPVSSRS